MIKVRRSSDRRYVKNGSQEQWLTFDPESAADPSRRSFRSLDLLNEVKLLPGTEFRLQSDGHHESVTYVRQGRLRIGHRRNSDEVLGAGSCQRANSQPLMIMDASDESLFQGAHIFVSSLAPFGEDGEPSCERRHYPFSDRHGHLRLIASPGGAASLRLRQNVRIYSAVLDPGHHVVHELGAGRGAWLHVVEGRVHLADQSLESGDGASLDGEAAISFTAQEPSEILLFDLA